MAARDDDKADGAAPGDQGGPLVAMVKGYLDLDAARRADERHWRHVVVRHADNVERRLTDIRDLVLRGDPADRILWAVFGVVFIGAITAIVSFQRDQLAELRAVRELLAAQAAQGVCDVP